MNNGQWSEKVILLNLFLTQGIILLIGIIFYYLFFFRRGVLLQNIFPTNHLLTDVITATAFALIVVVINIVIDRKLPKNIFDDKGINKLLFSNRSIVHILVITLVVAFCEEFLFRIIIQPFLGIFLTSLIFTAIHIRYLSNWLLPLFVFVVSYGLGWIYEWTGSGWTPIIAHFWIDFILGMLIRLRILYR